MSRDHSLVHRTFVPGLLLVVVGIAAAGLVAPAPIPRDADATSFSAQRAREHVQAIAVAPRPIGSPGNAAARAWIVERLRDLGLEPVLQRVGVPDYYGSRGEVPVVNVTARIDGQDSSGAILLVAHYDTVPETPGANDNACAVAAVLETARALRSGAPLRNDVILLFTDGEEPAPRYGARAFVEHHPAARDVRLVINLDAVGCAGVCELVEVLGNEQAIVELLGSSVERPAASSLLEDVVEGLGGSNTDLSVFRDRGVAGLEFAYFRGAPVYHTERDDLASLHLGGLQHHGDLMLSLTRRFGSLDLGPFGRPGQAVYFTVAGRWLFAYPRGFGIGLAIAALGLLGVHLRSVSRARRALVPAGALLGIVLAVTVGAALVWRALTALLWERAGPGIAVGYAWLGALVAVGVLTTLLLSGRLARRTGPDRVEHGTLVLWCALGLASSLVFPGAGYLFAWPALAATLAALFPGRVSGSRLAAFGAVAAVALLLAIPVLDTFHHAAQPRPGNPGSELPEAAGVVGLLVSLLTLLLASPARRARRSGG